MTDPVPQRILAINVSRIGDTLLATPALRAIAQAYPHAKITMLGHPKRVEVLKYLPFLHRVGGITKRRAQWQGRFGTPQYDLAFVWGYDAALVAYALRVSRRVVAFRQADQNLNRRLFRSVEPPAFQSDHAVNLAMALPAAIGIAAVGQRLAYQVTEEEMRWAEATLSADLPVGAAPCIGFQVASFPTKAYRDWPLENFCVLANRLRTAYPAACFLIFGGSEENERTGALKRHLGTAAILYAGRLSLRQTGALMSRLDLYVGVDTGPTHLMSCFDIPMVGLYHGFSRSELIAPLEHPCFQAVDHPLAGPGCSEEVDMADITVEAVFLAVQRVLASSARVGWRR